MKEIFDFIVNLFVDDGIIIAVAAFIVGQIIKSLKVPNKFIPLICGGLGAILGIEKTTVVVGKNIVTCRILGLALDWGATGGYETVKKKKKGGE